MHADSQSALGLRPRPRAADRCEPSPLVVFVETTRACDLACTGCRPPVRSERDPGELSTAETRALLDDVARFSQPPVVMLVGGDPLRRPDLAEIVAHGASRGLTMAMAAAATPLVSRDALLRLADSGLSRLAVGLDGATAGSHDAWRGVRGSFEKTLEVLADARDCGLSLQVNTTVHRGNAAELLELANLLDGTGIVSWSPSFLVPVHPDLVDKRVPAEKYEEVFALLARESKRRSFVIRVQEAPHYRRFVTQQRRRARGDGGGSRDFPDVPSIGKSSPQDGSGTLFVGHTGRIQPSGLLPLVCGRFPDDSVVDVYQHHPLLTALRDSDGLHGKCGACEFRPVCGGSRARAWALTGDVLAPDPDCVYQPPAWRRAQLHAVEAARA